MPEPLRILMTAGEVSGDRQAAYLAAEILRKRPSVRLYGTGGAMMEQAGVQVMIRATQYGSVGFQESLRFVRPLRAVLRRLRTLVRTERPDLAILVDNEGFNGMVSRFLAREGIPFIYYFPPQVWLWGEWRARAIARRAHAIIPAFSAEVAIYRREGGNVRWFGHPLLDIVRTKTLPGDRLSSLGLDPREQTIALMPGSRLQEIEQLLDPFLDALRLVRRVKPGLQCILPAAAPHLLPELTQRIEARGMKRDVVVIRDDVYSALSACTAGIFSSGTATLEAALLGLPVVVAYRVAPLTYAIGRKIIRSRYIAMPNILLDEAVIPEVIQDDVHPVRLAQKLLGILENTSLREQMRTRLLRTRAMLGGRGALPQVASFVLREATLLNDRSTRQAAPTVLP